MTCLGCKYARLCIMYEPRMKACKDYENDNSARQEVTDMNKQNDLINREFEKWAKRKRDGVAVINKKKNRQAPCLHF